MLANKVQQDKTVTQKYNALKDLEKGLSNKKLLQICTKEYPFHLVEKWKKDFLNIWTVQSEMFGSGVYDDVDQTVFKWFNSKKSQQIFVDEPVFEEKATDFAKTWNIPSFPQVAT